MKVYRNVVTGIEIPEVIIGLSFTFAVSLISFCVFPSAISYIKEDPFACWFM